MASTRMLGRAGTSTRGRHPADPFSLRSLMPALLVLSSMVCPSSGTKAAPEGASARASAATKAKPSTATLVRRPPPLHFRRIARNIHNSGRHRLTKSGTRAPIKVGVSPLVTSSMMSRVSMSAVWDGADELGESGLTYSRYSADDFEILEKIGSVAFGEAAPTTVYVGGGSEIRLYAARLAEARASYESAEQAAAILVLREHTAAAAEVGRREWAAYRVLAIDSFSPAPTQSDPLNFGPVIGAFETQSVDAIRETDTSVWTVTRLSTLDRDALTFAYEVQSRRSNPKQVFEMFRRIASGAVGALLETHSKGLAHGGIDCTSICILAGEAKSDETIREIRSGLGNFGYSALLAAKNEEEAWPFLLASRLAASAGRRGLEKDMAQAAGIARREDMRRLGVALFEVLLIMLNLTTDWLPQPEAIVTQAKGAVGCAIPLDGGKEALENVRAEVRRLMVESESLEKLQLGLGSDDNAGWEWLGLLLAMDETENPLIQLNKAARHRFLID